MARWRSTGLRLTCSVWCSNWAWPPYLAHGCWSAYWFVRRRGYDQGCPLGAKGRSFPLRVSCAATSAEEAYSPECVEGASLLKNSLCARFHLRSGTKYADFGAFGTRFVVAFGSMPTFQQCSMARQGPPRSYENELLLSLFSLREYEWRLTSGRSEPYFHGPI